MNNKHPLFSPLSEEQASYRVYKKLTEYSDTILIYIPNEPYQKIIPGMEVRPRPKSQNSSIFEDESDIERSLRRTEKAIKDYAKTNQFELWCTFTFATDRTDIEKCKNRMAYWLQRQRKKSIEFEYLIVMEMHKDKEAPHFHALIKGYIGKLLKSINQRTGEQIIDKGMPVFCFNDYKHGFNYVKKIDGDPKTQRSIGKYLTKYITKDMSLFFGKHRFRASKGLVKPNEIANPKIDLSGYKPMNVYGNSRGVFMEYLKSDIKEKIE